MNLNLVRQLLDLFSSIPNTTDIQISVTKSCIDWAVSERRSFLRQSLETRLVTLYMAKQSYYDALTLINALLKELKRLDDKLVLVEVQLLESRVYHALGKLLRPVLFCPLQYKTFHSGPLSFRLRPVSNTLQNYPTQRSSPGNQPKARAALTSARTSAASVYTPPLLQAGLDMQSGQLHAEDKDFNTAFSYFIEALEGYSSQEAHGPAISALQYMLLCKIMLNLSADVNTILGSKIAVKYTSPSFTLPSSSPEGAGGSGSKPSPSKSLEAMKAIAHAHADRSLDSYERTLTAYRAELFSDPFVKSHLFRLYDSMLEQNLIKVIEPFSRVEIAHVAAMVGLDVGQVERKLSQMILDKVVVGVLDQGSGCLIVYEEAGRDEGFDAALETIEKLSGVVDVLYTNQASLLE